MGDIKNIWQPMQQHNYEPECTVAVSTQHCLASAHRWLWALDAGETAMGGGEQATGSLREKWLKKKQEFDEKLFQIIQTL